MPSIKVTILFASVSSRLKLHLKTVVNCSSLFFLKIVLVPCYFCWFAPSYTTFVEVFFSKLIKYSINVSVEIAVRN